ncbi:delta-like protein B [Paramacrobiotus metropolitanus]|uniref:delta-like protein B n=1 Tax=Paramacrobiotus metropolitanus TaxID=2943436 RepID=UPI002445F76B|nr:delta-like protein B [Paramacrobiotus metropolitanus]
MLFLSELSSFYCIDAPIFVSMHLISMYQKMYAINLCVMVILLVVSFGQSQTQASGVFEIRLKTVEKLTFTIDRVGGCCKNANGECSDECNAYFRICLKHFQSNIVADPPCTFGAVKISPTSDADGVDNSILEKFTTKAFPFKFKWPESFSVVIEAWHQPQPSPIDHHAMEDNRSRTDDQLLAQFSAHHTLRPHANWTEVAAFSTGTNTPLFYAYRIVCNEHYYGIGCENFCQARNDTHGHYMCSKNGAKICSNGWTGPYCEIPICSPGCHAQNGYCEVPNECKCRLGWQGRDCSECIRYPGCERGTCQQPFQCNCDEGWGGLFCSLDLNYCTHHQPCDNGGTCANTGQGSYTCTCADGFTGRNCELRKNPCVIEPCRNDGVCRSSRPGNYTCDCQEGFFGKNCESTTRTCVDSPCRNQGLCHDNPATGYECSCPSGYTGKNCEHRVGLCSQNPCKNGGTCADLLNTFSCTCPAGFAGSTCQVIQQQSVDNCSLTPCLNAGTCIHDDRHHTYTCLCPAGYDGALCQQPLYDKCADNPCQHGASCEDRKEGGFLCHCPQGFVGKLCDIPDETNSIERLSMTGSTLRLQSANSVANGLTSAQLYGAIGGGVVLVVLIVLVGWAGWRCVAMKNRQREQRKRATPATEVNFSMNNLHKAPYSIPHGPKEWKPIVTVQTEAEEYYAVLPKRNNGCPPIYTPSSSAMPLAASGSGPLMKDAIYMKVMTDPPPYHSHHNYRKSYISHADKLLDSSNIDESFSGYKTLPRRSYAVC